MPELHMYKGSVYLWKYVPNLPVSITFSILFGLITVAHAWKMYKTRMWMCAPFVIGGVCEELGYICRAIAWDSTGSLPIYIMQATFLLLPPVFFAVSLYMLYTRLVRTVQGQACSIISPKRATRIFVIGDLITLNIQSTGASLVANPKLVDIGNPIIIAGLIAQVILFIFFMICCMVFHVRFAAQSKGVAVVGDVPWRSHLHMLYCTSILILVRNVFRVIEFIMGDEGYLVQKEWPTFLFDSVLMLVVMIAFYIRYPDDLQPSSYHLDARDSAIEFTVNSANSIENNSLNLVQNQRSESISQGAAYS